MELLESQDPEKRKLIEASDKYKRDLEKQVSALSTDTQKLLTNALIVGGVLGLSYLMVRGFSSSGGKKKHKKAKKVTLVQPQVSRDEEDNDAEVAAGTPSLMAEIGTRIANQATVILIDLARQKLMEYLESRKKD